MFTNDETLKNAIDFVDRHPKLMSFVGISAYACMTYTGVRIAKGAVALVKR